MAKYLEIATLLEQRIANGEYVSGKLPPLRKLADEMGVSYLTARQAVKHLEQSGDFERDEVGRMLVPAETAAVQHPLVALITPHWNFDAWQQAIRDETMALGGQLRVIAYSSNTDPVITEALSGNFDLFFLVLPTGDNARLLERLAKLGKKAVVLFDDRTEYGIRSLVGMSVDSARKLLEKLRQTGHESIDVISFRTDRGERPFRTRIEVWHDFLVRYNLHGTCRERELAAFSREEECSYLFSLELLRKHPLPDAFYCMTPSIAFGFYRACYDCGITVGRDVSVISYGHMGMARLMTPPLATVYEVDINSRIRKLIAEYLPGAKLSSRMLFQMDEVGIFEGDSIKNNPDRRIEP